MDITAIYCVWNDQPALLLRSILNIVHHVDHVMVIYSNKSNYGEVLEDPISDYLTLFHDVYRFEPDLSLSPMQNETNKRNYGIQKARELGYTHFVMMDADEFYDSEEFVTAKEQIGDKAGLVCRSKVYFREPTLTIGYDTTLVPFIHKLTPTIQCTFNRNYPFAWTDQDGVAHTKKKRIRIDPTRSYNINDGVYWSDVTMHHMSWIRSDISKKIRNSTARANIERSTIVHDYVNAKPGYFCNFYQKTLIECPNVFGIPNIIDYDAGKTLQVQKP